MTCTRKKGKKGVDGGVLISTQQLEPRNNFQAKHLQSQRGSVVGQHDFDFGLCCEEGEAEGGKMVGAVAGHNGEGF
jgi:hypothetical protein